MTFVVDDLSVVRERPEGPVFYLKKSDWEDNYLIWATDAEEDNGIVNIYPTERPYYSQIDGLWKDEVKTVPINDLWPLYYTSSLETGGDSGDYIIELKNSLIQAIREQNDLDFSFEFNTGRIHELFQDNAIAQRLSKLLRIINDDYEIEYLIYDGNSTKQTPILLKMKDPTANMYYEALASGSY